ncbi:Transcriptional regulatory protein sin3, partial [Tulasnella sp. 417]
MPKVLISRNLGTDAMALIMEKLKDYEASRSILSAGSPQRIVVWPEDRVADRAWLLENVSGSQGVLVTLNDKVDEELLAKAGPGLKIVSTMSVGYEHVRIQELASRSIKLGYTPDVLTDAGTTASFYPPLVPSYLPLMPDISLDSVADVAIMLALMAGRNVAHGLSIVQSG